MELSVSSSMQDFLGISFTHITEKELTATMPVNERTCQVHGFLNGGASLALCEICAGTLSLHLLKNTGKTALGVQVSANHLKTAKSGETVTCKVTPVKIGNSLHVFDALVLNKNNEILCRASVTNMVVTLNK